MKDGNNLNVKNPYVIMVDRSSGVANKDIPAGVTVLSISCIREYLESVGQRGKLAKFIKQKM